MGSQACRAGPPNYTDNVSIRQIPELTHQIRDFIYTKKPFDKQLQKQTKKLRRYPDGIYDGPIGIMDSPSGYGKVYKNDGSLFIGHFSIGKANGEGVLIFPDGSYLQGTFQSNKIKKGQYSSKLLLYKGEFNNNIFEGQGYLKNFKDFYQFQGKFHEGKMKQGTMKWTQKKTQFKYQGKFTEQGQFQNGGTFFNNQGKLTEQPQGFYVGQFKNYKKHGKGTYQYKNGIKYVGQYKQGLKDGLGTLYNGDGTISYQGNFTNGLPHGEGKAYNRQGMAVQTNWVQGIDSTLLIKQR